MFRGDSNIIINTNNGVINTSGDNAEGIFALGSRNRITNSGKIITTGSRADGIYANNDNEVANSGAITTSGDNADGIFVVNRNQIYQYRRHYHHR